VETDPIRVCELLVGLPDVIVEGVTDTVDGPLIVHVAQRIDDVVACSACGTRAWVKDRPVVELVDLGAFRATDAAVVAEASAVVPEPVVSDRFVDVRGSGDRVDTTVDHDTRSALGDTTGW
jgi:hypothetical protein